MKRINRRFFVIIVALTLFTVILTATAAFAHNAGHIHFADGRCLDVGSGKHNVHVDLIPGSGDQYGTRYAAEQGNTPIWPRHCDEPGAHNHP